MRGLGCPLCGSHVGDPLQAVAQARSATRASRAEREDKGRNQRTPRCELVARRSVTVVDAGQNSLPVVSGHYRPLRLLHFAAALLHALTLNTATALTKDRTSGADVRQD